MEITKYVVGAAEQKDRYWWGGRTLGFTNIIESAVGYVSPEIAKLAADVVDKNERKDWPRMLKIRAIKVVYRVTPTKLYLPGIVFSEKLTTNVTEVISAEVVP